MPRSIGVRQLPSPRCGCDRCRKAYPKPERKPTKGCTGNWQSRWYDETGKRDSATRGTKDDAIKARTAALAAIDAGTYKDPKRGQLSLAVWRTEHWLKGRRVEGTSEARDETIWRAHIEPRWGGKPLRAIRHQDVQNWIVGLEDAGLAPHTVRIILSCLRQPLDAAKRDGRIEVSPCLDVVVRSARERHVELPYRKPPTIDQVQLAVAQITAPPPRGGRRRRPDIFSRIPLIILETGLRWGEVIGLLPDCLDLEADEVHVRRVVEQVGSRRVLREYPKSDASNRTVPLTCAAHQLFLEHLEIQPLERGASIQPGIKGLPIFRTTRGTLHSRSNYRDRVWLPATIAAGIHQEYRRPSGQLEHWPSLHDIRHAYGSRLENAGVPESARKEALGHERPTSRDVTWVYTHAPEQSRELILAALGDEPNAQAKPVARRLRLVG